MTGVWIFFVVAVAIAAYQIGRAVGEAPPGPPRRGGRQFSAQIHGIFHKNFDGSGREEIIAVSRVNEKVFLYP